MVAVGTTTCRLNITNPLAPSEASADQASTRECLLDDSRWLRRMGRILAPTAPSGEDAHLSADFAPVLDTWGCSHPSTGGVVTRQHLALGVRVSARLSVRFAHNWSIRSSLV